MLRRDAVAEGLQNALEAERHGVLGDPGVAALVAKLETRGYLLADRRVDDPNVKGTRRRLRAGEHGESDEAERYPHLAILREPVPARAALRLSRGSAPAP